MVAKDRAGNEKREPLNLVVDRQAPVVVWRRPADGAQVSGTVTLEVEATDNVGVAKVEFFAGSTKLGEVLSAPYTFSWDTTAYPDGEVTLRARAVDGSGNSAEAALRVVVANRDRQAPVVVWRRPADGAQVSGTVTLEVEATDNVGVAKVEFFAGSTKLGEVLSAPYTFSWDTTAYPDGEVTLRARAVDGSGNSAEAALRVVVANAPEIYWVNPVANELVAGFVRLEAEVRAVRNVDTVEFYFGSNLDSLSKIPGTPTVSGSLYSLAWDVLRVTPGVYFLKAVVIDVAGARDEAVIPVQVGSAFVLDSPSDGDQVGPGANRTIVAVTVGVRGTLPPGVSITQVEVYINGYLVGTAVRQTAGDGSEVYVFSWDTQIPSLGHDPNAPGDRVITARVYYTGGDTFTNGVRVLYLP